MVAQICSSAGRKVEGFHLVGMQIIYTREGEGEKIPARDGSQ
jgi:hypothetical protein